MPIAELKCISWLKQIFKINTQRTSKTSKEKICIFIRFLQLCHSRSIPLPSRGFPEASTYSKYAIWHCRLKTKSICFTVFFFMNSTIPEGSMVIGQWYRTLFSPYLPTPTLTWLPTTPSPNLKPSHYKSPCQTLPGPQSPLQGPPIKTPSSSKAVLHHPQALQRRFIW